MSRVCDICGKKQIVGNNVSHAHKKTKRSWKPNLQRRRVVQNGSARTLRICTSCLKAGKISTAD